MLFTKRNLFKPRVESIALRKKVSLSTYFPKGTAYFYGYPAGEDSGFLNRVPPYIEELVAARAYSCAGPDISVIGFAATQAPFIEKDLLDKLAIPQLSPRQTLLLPHEIDAAVQGSERNKVVKAALMRLAPQHTLVMAQPYTDSHMASIYQIPPALTNWLNDKNNMPQYIPGELLAQRLAIYTGGSELVQNYRKLSLPYVIKVSSSSSGDGVHICLTKQDTSIAIEKLRDFVGTIFVERYIEATKNYGVHFGIPESKHAPIDLLGVNEQITSPEGEFLGGVISSDEIPHALQKVMKRLRDEILPKVRQKGWYGIGCFDVLVDQSGQHYFIDGNFRMTGMSAYHLLIANGALAAPVISFSGEFVGNKEMFEKSILPFAAKENKQRSLQLIALSKNGKTWRLNGALCFKTQEQLHERITSILAAGIKSQALSQILQ